MSTPPAPVYLTGDKAAVDSFVDRFDTFLFDCDGVLWSGNDVLDRVPETLEKLASLGKKLIFVTNNSTNSRAAYAKKFATLGLPPPDPDRIFGSSYSAAVYMSQILKLPAPRNKIFVLGASGIEEELRGCGVPFIGGTDPAFVREIEERDFKDIASGRALDPNVGAVLLGFDTHINYLKTSLAMAYVRAGALLFATNTDVTYPNSGALFPGAGAMMAPVITATGKFPVSLGKPSRAMMDAIEAKFKLDRARTCMIGDRLNTDIKFGIDGKLGGTLLVLTGVTVKEDFLVEGAETVPSAYSDKLSDLLG